MKTEDKAASECKNCGCSSYEIELVGCDKETDTRVFNIEFDCGSIFEYVEQGGSIVKYLWDDNCKRSTYH